MSNLTLKPKRPAAVRFRPGEEPDPRLFPDTNKVIASGGSYCSSTMEIGTVGVRVDRPTPNRYCYLETYHQFGDSGAKDWFWLFAEKGKLVTGQRGTVIDRAFDPGPSWGFQTMDAALVQLETGKPSDLERGVFRVSPKVAGTASVQPGDLVTKYGVMTGRTYGVVVALPEWLDPSYDRWIFAVENADQSGYPIAGYFGDSGDSGAAVMVKRGGACFVAGMYIWKVNPPYPALSFVSRIGQIEQRLKVKVHIDI